MSYRDLDGLELMITEDAVIYHRGSGKFSNTCPTVKKMVKKNKRLFRKKRSHGIVAN